VQVKARYRSPLAASMVVAAMLAVGGCGSTSHRPESPPLGALAQAVRTAHELPLPAALTRGTKATLIIDFTPNAVHAGIYRALAAGYYRQEHIDLKVVQPSATVETLKLIEAGKAQFGLADGSDVAGLIARGGDARAVMAIAQRPLGGLIALASEHLRSPADLQGRTVGITGVPSDTAVLDTEVRHAGGDPRKVRVVTIGFNGAQALVAGKIAAFTGFIPDDGVQLQVSGHPITAFGLAENGGPAYPGLVAFTTRREISSDPALVRDFVAATARGYEDTLRNPARSLTDLERLNPTLPPKLTRASLKVYLPLFFAGGRTAFGTLKAGNLAAMSAWMLQRGLIDAAVTPARYGTDRFIPAGG
jgi:putative hydroxymethylpyrimidine transport system substrate-binding protein